MVYRIAIFAMTLSDLQDHVLIASLFRYDFSYCRTAADKVSTDIAHRAVHLR